LLAEFDRQKTAVRFEMPAEMDSPKDLGKPYHPKDQLKAK